MFKKFSTLILTALTITSCSKKAPPPLANLSANRNQAYVLKLTEQVPSTDRASYLDGVISTALRDTYGSKILPLKFGAQGMVEDPENIYQIGINLIDDLFIFSMQDNQDVNETSVTVYNGSNLRIVTILKFSVPKEGKDPFEKRWLDTFRRVALEKFPNPNIYPRATPSHFANLLYVYGQQQEKALKEPLTCTSAPQVYQFYPKARELFQIAKEKEPMKAVGSQEAAQTLTSRLLECEEKTATLQKCIEDSKKSFGLQWEFEKIDPASNTFIMEAAAKADLEGILKQYTNKPVKMGIQSDTGSNMNFTLTLRYDPIRYLSWTKNRVPSRVRNFQILSLDPYFALMQKMVVFRASLPDGAPGAIRTSFSKMRMNLVLETILNGEALMGVEGKYDPKTKSITMAYPNSVYLKSPGFEQKLIQGQDKDIFQEKTWIALGNCKTIDGSTTEDGLLIQFFGLPCN